VVKTVDYKPVNCHRCKLPMVACEMSTVYDMRVDGVLHKVPVSSVPCAYCTACDVSVIDQCADEAIQRAYHKYITEAGLNTPYLRIRRWIRRRVLGFWNRIQRDWYRSMRTLRRETT
jgi:hypothetical protein